MKDRALVGSSSDPKQQARAKKLESLLREIELGDTKWIISDRRGRRFLWRLLNKCGIFKSIWDASSAIRDFNAGQHDLGTSIIAEIFQADTEAFATMMREAKQEESNAGTDRPRAEPEPESEPESDAPG